MSSLHVVATIPVKPELAELASAGLSQLEQATREGEGCISYVLYESAAAPGTFITVEEWRSQADLDTHLKSDHVAKAFSDFGAHLSGEVSVHPLRLV